MLLKVEAICDRGCVRSNNEDHILVPGNLFSDAAYEMDIASNGIAVFAIADGMGGHNAGEVASKIVLTSLKDFAEKCSPDTTLNSLQKQFTAWLEKIHAEIKDAGVKNYGQKDMGTTLSGLFFGNKRTYVFNAGDSKTFVFNGKELIQVTRDHTLGETTGLRGLNASLLVNCIGAVSKPMIDVDDVSDYANPGNVFLVCSDGLTDMLASSKIGEFLKKKNTKAMVEEAKRKGGRDNISVITIRMAD